MCVPPLIAVCSLISDLSTYGKISDITVAAIVSGTICTAVTTFYSLYMGKNIFSWGDFGQDHIAVKVVFRKSFRIRYSDCYDCGIGYYTHGILNGPIGSSVFYIYFSCDNIPKRILTQINMLHNDEQHIKVPFKKELYEYLLTVLPKRQAEMLKKAYMQYSPSDNGIITFAWRKK